MRKLGKNTGGYFGDPIQIESVIRDSVVAGNQFGWAVQRIPVAPGLEITALTRSSSPGARNIYLSAGIHGDEPAGPLAIHQLLADNTLPPTFNYWLLPCLNPTGFPLNKRENAGGVDLNRDYRHILSLEVRAHLHWLQAQPRFDLCLCLHEDWEANGFYLYEANPDGLPTLAETIIQAVEPVCPIDLSPEIEGRPARGGIIRPNLDPASRPQWPELFYLLQHKSRLGYTLEAPSDFPLQTRVSALVAAIHTSLTAFASL